jgi:type I restriction enzyme S subunit
MISDVTRQPGKYLSATREGVTEAGAALSRRLPAGSLILSNSGTICVPKILSVEGCIHDGFVAFDGLENNVDLNFAYWWFEYVRPRMIDENRQGMTQVNLNTDIVRDIHFPLAPRNQQARVVQEIEKQISRLDAATAALKRVQANLKRYRASVLKAACEGRLVPTEAELARKEGREYESASELLKRILRERRARWEADTLTKMIASGKPPKDDRWKQKYKEPAKPDRSSAPGLPDGWCWSTLEQLSSVITSGSRGWGDLYSDSGPLFIRAQDIKTDSLLLQDAARVELPTDSEGTRTLVRRSDLLVTITGANVTKTALVDHQIEEAYVSQHVGLVRPVMPETSSYLYIWIVSPMQGRADLTRVAYGAGKPGLNLDNLRELCVGLPPLAEQKRLHEELSQILSSVVDLETGILRNLRHASGLRNSVLSAAFKGELVPQDPTDEPASVLLERIRAERAASAKPTPKRSKRGRREEALVAAQ